MLFKRNNHKSSLLDRSLLLFGDKNHSDDHFTLRDLCEHLFICGSTGTGKTSTVGYHLAKRMLNADGLSEEEKIGMVVFLYKSSDIHQWIRWAEEQKREEDIIVIGPNDRDIFNVLEAYGSKEAITAVDVLMILSGLSMNGSSQHNSEQYWEQMTRQRLHRLTLLNQLSGEPLSISTLYRLHSTAPQSPEQMNKSSFQENSYCWHMLARSKSLVGEENAQFRLVEDYFVREMPFMADRTQSSILSLAGGILEPFISSPLLNRLFCGKTTIRLDDMLAGKIVLLNLPIQQYEYSAKLAQIILKHILQKRIEERDLNSCPNPVCLWIDEYQHFISPYDFLFLSTARSSRAGCILMTQNVSNLFAQVGGNGKTAEEKVNALLALTNHKIFLAQNNSITNEFASKIIGKGIHKLTNGSIQMQDFAGNTGFSSSYDYQVLPREFTMLKRGGYHNNGIVQTYVTATGKTFSNGKNFLKVQFQQPWFQ